LSYSPAQELIILASKVCQQAWQTT